MAEPRSKTRLKNAGIQAKILCPTLSSLHKFHPLTSVSSVSSFILKSAFYKCFHVGSTDIIIMIKWLYTEIGNYLADQQKAQINVNYFVWILILLIFQWLSVKTLAVPCSLTSVYSWPEMLARPTYFSECVNKTNSDFVFVMVMDKKVTGRVCSITCPVKEQLWLEGFSTGLGFLSGMLFLLLNKKWTLERGFPSLVRVSLFHGIS